MAKAESGLRKRIRNALHAEGVLVLGQPANAYTGPGRSDFIACVRGTFLALEVKTPTGDPTPAQLHFLWRVRSYGGYAWIVRTPRQAVLAARLTQQRYLVAEDAAFDFDSFLSEIGLNPDSPTLATDAGVAGVFLEEETSGPASALFEEQTADPEAGYDGPLILPTADVTAILPPIVNMTPQVEVRIDEADAGSDGVTQGPDPHGIGVLSSRLEVALNLLSAHSGILSELRDLLTRNGKKLTQVQATLNAILNSDEASDSPAEPDNEPIPFPSPSAPATVDEALEQGRPKPRRRADRKTE